MVCSYLHFFVWLFHKRFFFLAHGSIEYKIFLKSSIWSIDVILTGTITPDKSESTYYLRVMATEEYLVLPRALELKSHHQCDAA